MGGAPGAGQDGPHSVFGDGYDGLAGKRVTRIQADRDFALGRIDFGQGGAVAASPERLAVQKQGPDFLVHEPGVALAVFGSQFDPLLARYSPDSSVSGPVQPAVAALPGMGKVMLDERADHVAGPLQHMQILHTDIHPRKPDRFFLHLPDKVRKGRARRFFIQRGVVELEEGRVPAFPSTDP